MSVKRSYGWKSMSPPSSQHFILPCVKAILKNKKIESVFDIGCGNGALCHALFQEGYHIAGMEYDQQGYDIARQSYPAIEFFHGSVYEANEQIREAYPSGFDCVISTEVIEHLFSPQELPLFATQLLKPQGLLIISTPYHGYVKNCLISLLNGWDVHCSPLWEGGHIKFWSRKTLTKLLRNNGFCVMEFHGCGRVPYLWKSMILVAQKL